MPGSKSANTQLHANLQLVPKYTCTFVSRLEWDLVNHVLKLKPQKNDKTFVKAKREQNKRNYLHNLILLGSNINAEFIYCAVFRAKLLLEGKKHRIISRNGTTSGNWTESCCQAHETKLCSTDQPQDSRQAYVIRAFNFSNSCDKGYFRGRINNPPSNKRPLQPNFKCDSSTKKNRPGNRPVCRTKSVTPDDTGTVQEVRFKNVIDTSWFPRRFAL